MFCFGVKILRIVKLCNVSFLLSIITECIHKTTKIFFFDEMYFSLFQHLGDSSKLLEDIASGKHPFAQVCNFIYRRSYSLNKQLDQHLVRNLMRKRLTNNAHTGLDKQNSEHKSVNIFLPISLSICFGCSKEPSHSDSSFEYSKHMFWLREKIINFLVHTLN